MQQGEDYKRVLDGNARQSNATKDQQMNALRTHERERFLFLVHGSSWGLMVYLGCFRMQMEPKSLD